LNWEGPDAESFDAFLTEWRLVTADRDLVPSSGDSSNDAAQRLLDVLDEIVDLHPDGTIVVVTRRGAQE